jgi:hypothetical protein
LLLNDSYSVNIESDATLATMPVEIELRVDQEAPPLQSQEKAFRPSAYGQSIRRLQSAKRKAGFAGQVPLPAFVSRGFRHSAI